MFPGLGWSKLTGEDVIGQWFLQVPQGFLWHQFISTAWRCGSVGRIFANTCKDYSPSTLEVEAEGSEVQGQLRLRLKMKHSSLNMCSPTESSFSALTRCNHLPWNYCPLFMLQTANHLIHSNSRAEDNEPKPHLCLCETVGLKWRQEVNILINIWTYYHEGSYRFP